MSGYVGDIRGKVDSKGRMVLPSAFKKKMSAEGCDRFIVKKDIYDNCLVLYPEKEWDRQVALIKKKLNPYNRAHNMFLRKFFKEAVEVELDALNRMLIPKSLLESASITKEVVFIGEMDKIEIWAPEELEKANISQEEFKDLAEEIFKDLTPDE